MLRRMGAKLFNEWRAFEELEPFEDIRQDWRMAQLVAKLANLHRNLEAHPEPYPISDFLLNYGNEKEEARPKTEEEKKQEILEEAARIKRKLGDYFKPEPPRPKPKPSIYPQPKRKVRANNGRS